MELKETVVFFLKLSGTSLEAAKPAGDAQSHQVTFEHHLGKDRDLPDGSGSYVLFFFCFLHSFERVIRECPTRCPRVTSEDLRPTAAPEATALCFTNKKCGNNFHPTHSESITSLLSFLVLAFALVHDHLSQSLAFMTCRYGSILYSNLWIVDI